MYANFELITLLLIIPVLSFLNRERGADRFPKSDLLSKLVVGMILSELMFTFSPLITLTSGWKLLWLIAPVGGYILGESMGWGKWIGGVIGHGSKSEYYKKQGYSDGIHWITSQVIDQRDDYLNYCRFALFLRGIWWWFPALLPLLIFGCFGGWVVGPIKFVIGMLLLGVGFPASVEIARLAFIKIKNKNIVELGDGNIVWSWAEWIYGAWHGLIIMSLILIN
jgi:hypothetical protein